MKNALILLGVLAAAVFVYLNFFKEEEKKTEQTDYQKLLDRIRERSQNATSGASHAIANHASGIYSGFSRVYPSTVNPDVNATMPSTQAAKLGDFEMCLSRCESQSNNPASCAFQCSTVNMANYEGSTGWQFSNANSATYTASAHTNFITTNNYQQ